MSSLFHQKYHRHNHYTATVSSDIYPDAGKDPIASYESPFQGDFVINGALYTNNAYFASDNIGIKLKSENICLSTIGDVHFDKVTRAVDLTATRTSVLTAEYIVSNNKRCFTQFNKKDYNLRTWEIATSIDNTLNYIKPTLIERIDREYFNEPGNYLGSSVEFIVDGTYPLEYTWYKTINKQSIITEFKTVKKVKSYEIAGYTNNKAENYIVYYNERELTPYVDYTLIISNTKGFIVFQTSLINENDNVRVLALQGKEYYVLPFKKNFITADKTYSINLYTNTDIQEVVHNLNNKKASIVIIDQNNIRLKEDQYIISDRTDNTFKIQFIKNNKDFSLVQVFIEHTIGVSEYTLVVTNSHGQLSASVNIPFDEDNIVNHRDHDIVTHLDELLGIDYTYLDVTGNEDTETSLLITNNDFNYILI